MSGSQIRHGQTEKRNLGVADLVEAFTHSPIANIFERLLYTIYHSRIQLYT